jgi:hypothetical protein
VVAGKVNLTFAQLCWRNLSELKEGTMPFSLKTNNPSLRHTLAPSVCGMFFAAISGRRKGVSGFQL